MREWKRYSVYQIREDAPDRSEKIFKPYDWIEHKFGKVNMDDYECIYSGEWWIENLDSVFTLCNTNPRPVGYKGHSLSVSDVVELDNKLYYCDGIGWKEI